MDLTGNEPTNPILNFRLPGYSLKPLHDFTSCYNFGFSDLRHLIDYFSGGLLGSIQQLGVTGASMDPTFLQQVCFRNSPCNRHVIPAGSDQSKRRHGDLLDLSSRLLHQRSHVLNKNVQHTHQLNGQRAHNSPKSWC